ncbi:hypothetical protein PAXRUDRAFT_554960 [Paxillus rubicundulus Ve08.2h10]|uniref:Unplaced genomic scaffold scaffold_421, whole genome shotgun sequence n=1 Tax=Paxillus rubicundulus Ve08.2h10 TaxID=930991 RepID=A0A0D0D7C3_9AGAM|nr:hypothetical protein PAXRUDRAFT_554960 [Paxillus rubicundulus Ve08.2h10]
MEEPEEKLQLQTWRTNAMNSGHHLPAALPGMFHCKWCLSATVQPRWGQHLPCHSLTFSDLAWSVLPCTSLHPKLSPRHSFVTLPSSPLLATAELSPSLGSPHQRERNTILHKECCGASPRGQRAMHNHCCKLRYNQCMITTLWPPG